MRYPNREKDPRGRSSYVPVDRNSRAAEGPLDPYRSLDEPRTTAESPILGWTFGACLARRLLLGNRDLIREGVDQLGNLVGAAGGEIIQARKARETGKSAGGGISFVVHCAPPRQGTAAPALSAVPSV
jgi:hypothetical protein